MKMEQSTVFNFHMHSSFSDGSAPPEVYVQEALKKGFHSLGFSDHSPLPFENSFAIQGEEKLEEYCAEINRLKQKYSDQLNIFLGLEVDFIKGEWEDLNYFRNNYNLDYIIGSVHLVTNPLIGERWFIDGPKVETYDEGLVRCFDGDIRAGVTAYYEHIMAMVSDYQPELVGHLDKIRMHNKDRYFKDDELWYTDLQEELLEVIRENKTIVEVNSRGLYKKRSDDFFPARPLLQRIYDKGIRITISSDAHQPEELDSGFSKAREAVKNIGFRSLMMLTRGGWEEVSL